MKKAKLFQPKKLAAKKFDGHLSRNALYAADWVRFRKEFIKVNPKCYACGGWATEVDHVTPHQGNVSLFWKETNYIPLCISCHSTVTAKFDRNHVTGQIPKAKLNWLHEKRIFSDTHVVVKIVNLPLDLLMKHGLKRY